MGNKLKGKSVVITGSGQGIGRAVAIAMAAEGANVITNNRFPGTLGGDAETTANEIRNIGGKALSFFGSVSEFDVGEKLVQLAMDNFGQIDVLVNCAGVLRERTVWNLSEEDWDLVIDVHLKGTFNCSRHAAAVMRGQRHGTIINLAAEAWRGDFGLSNYAAAKGGIVSFTKSIAKELSKYGVTVNAIAPLASTRMTASDEVKAAARKKLDAGIITKEFYDAAMNIPGPECVAPLFVYLASDKAANINGQVFHITRGKVAIYSEPVEIQTIHKTNDDGIWTVEDIERCMPNLLPLSHSNHGPAQVVKEEK